MVGLRGAMQELTHETDIGDRQAECFYTRKTLLVRKSWYLVGQTDKRLLIQLYIVVAWKTQRNINIFNKKSSELCL